jgi:hypothetical protein
MKNESIEDELKLLKIDFLTLQKNTTQEINRLDRVIIDMREHISYLYAKFELKRPERKHCVECDGRGKVYISPIMDNGQGNACRHCSGAGFRYL